MFVRISCGYLEEPIAIKKSDIFDQIRVDDLDISQGLKNDISDWDCEYQNTLNHDYPPDSAFPSREDKIRHRKVGEVLSIRLQKELGPEYKVVYIPV